MIVPPEIHERMRSFAHERAKECVEQIMAKHPYLSMVLGMSPQIMDDMYKQFGLVYLQGVLDFYLELHALEVLESSKLGYTVEDPYPN